MIPKCRVCRAVLTRDQIERFKVYCLNCHIKNWGRRTRAKLAVESGCVGKGLWEYWLQGWEPRA